MAGRRETDDRPGDVIGTIRAAIERQGWSETARRSRITRTTLHRAFGDTRHSGYEHIGPTLKTIERVLPHLGLELTIREVPR